MYARFITEMIVIEKVSEKKKHAGVKLERIIIIFFIIRRSHAGSLKVYRNFCMKEHIKWFLKYCSIYMYI